MRPLPSLSRCLNLCGRALPALALASLLAGCPNRTTTCESDADCGSRVCSSGSCVDRTTGGSSGMASGSGGASSGGSGSSGASGGSTSSGGSSSSGGGSSSSGSCTTGQVRCGGNCIDPMTNVQFCGASLDCTGDNAGVDCLGKDCTNGQCVTAGCPSAFPLLCNNVCINPDTSPNHCGATGDCAGTNAGDNCPAGSTCSGGDCVCSGGARLCADGCAAAGSTCCTNTDCTVPGETCVQVSAAGTVPVERQCRAGCQGGDLQNDPNNCGMCQNACPIPVHASVACRAGRCGRTACDPGYYDLDPDIFGCESTCVGRTCTLGDGTTVVTLTNPPIHEVGMFFHAFASGGAYSTTRQSNSTHANYGIMGESTPGGPSVEQSNSTHRNVGGFNAVLRR